MRFLSIVVALVVSLGLIFLGSLLIKDRMLSREVEHYRTRGLTKDSVIQRVVPRLQREVAVLSEHVDSLQVRYQRDSSTWQQQRDTLNWFLREEQQRSKKYQNAYERTKDALGKQIVNPPRLYDLDPVLQRDSTDPKRTNQPDPNR